MQRATANDAVFAYDRLRSLGSLDAEIQALVLGALPHECLFVARWVSRAWRALIYADPLDGMLRVAGCPPARCREEDRRWSTVCERFASHGWTRCAIWAHGAGHPWGPDTCMAALRAGRVETYLAVTGAGCPCGSPLASNLVRSGAPPESLFLSQPGSDCESGLSYRLNCLLRLDLDIGVHSDRAFVPPFSELFAVRWYTEPGERMALVSRLRDEDPALFATHEHTIVQVAQQEGDVALLRWLRHRRALWHGDFWSDLVAAGRMAFVTEILADLASRAPTGLAPDSADEAEFGSRTAAVFPGSRRVKWRMPEKSSACEAAAGLGDMASLLALRSAGFPWTGNECAFAAAAGRFDALRWLLDNGAPSAAEWDDDESTWAEEELICDKACKALVAGGQIPLMLRSTADGERFVSRNRTCTYAARSGRLDVLLWARSPEDADGPPGGPWHWDEATCAAAASRGHPAVLRWLRRGTVDPAAPAAVGWTPCPWDHRTLVGAIQAGRIDIFRWAAANGCPFRRVPNPDEDDRHPSYPVALEEEEEESDHGHPTRAPFPADALLLESLPRGADPTRIAPPKTGLSLGERVSRVLRESQRRCRERCSQYVADKKSGHQKRRWFSVGLPASLSAEMTPTDAMLCAAARRGYHGLVRHLCVARGASWNAHTLTHACNGTDPSVLRWMMMSGAHDPLNDAAAFPEALRADSPAAVRWLRANGYAEAVDDDNLWRSAAEQPALRVLRWMCGALPPPSAATHRFVLSRLAPQPASPRERDRYDAVRAVFLRSAHGRACEEVSALLLAAASRPRHVARVQATAM